MNTKASLSVGDLRVDLEGTEEFVSAQLEHWRTLMPLRTVQFQTPAGPDKPAANDPGDLSERPERKQRKQAKSSGPSCGSRIRGLIDDGFFEKPKKADEVSGKLREKATPYEGKHVAAALIHTVQGGRLRRVKADGIWTYVNP